MDIGEKLIASTLFKGLHKDSLNICGVFLCVTMEMDFSGKHPKSRDTKRAHVFHHSRRIYFLDKYPST